MILIVGYSHSYGQI